MAIEAGGKNGIIPADEITTAYVDARNAGNKPYEIFQADPNVRGMSPRCISTDVYFISGMHSLLDLQSMCALYGM